MSYETNPAKRVELLDYEKERLNVYHIEEMEDVFADRVGKPSHRIFETKGGRRALEGLRTIERDYNKSWTRCVRERWADILDKEMIFYRGNVISAEETFRRSDELARAMANAGIEKGDEIACCMSNVPEVLYLMNAASSLGAKLNFFGGHYDPEFVAIILSECSPKLFIATDDEFAKIRDIVKGQHFDHKVLVSLADSLPEHPETCEGYEPSLAADYQFENLAAKFVAEDPNLTTFADFVESGKSFTGEIIDDNGLDTEFLVTYTSGSTKIGFPKREIHRNRSLITVGVFHDPELCGNPAIHGLRGMAYIHTDTDTDLITMISDSMFQLWSVSFEPLYDRKTFLDRLVMNKPNFVLATTSFCVEAARQYLFEGRYAGRTLDSLLVLMAVGEACLPGEEKVINTFLRKARAGRGVNLAGPIHFPFVTVGVGGGDTEHGGVYYSLWRRMNEVLNKPKLHGKPYGLAPVPYVQATVLKEENGEYVECDYNECGIIVANSATTMAGYKDFSKVKEKILTDKWGVDWLSCDVYGYIDDLGCIHMKDRKDAAVTLEDGSTFLPFRLADCIQKDPKSVQTSLVTTVENNGKVYFIVNIDYSPLRKKEPVTILREMNERIKKEFPELKGRILYREFDEKNPFPVTGAGKRSAVEVANLGVAGTFQYVGNNKIPLTE